MKQAPHLPDKKNGGPGSVSHMGLKYIFLILVISVLSGAASALTIEAWLLPSGFRGSQISIERSQKEEKQKKELSQIKQQQLEQRIVKIYNKDRLLRGKYYPQGAQINTAAVLSSNGWTVLYQPDFQVSQIQNWQVINSNGEKLQIEDIKQDQASDLVYLKLSGDNFRVNSIYDWNQAKNKITLWNKYNDWRKYDFQWRERKESQNLTSVKTPQFFYQLNRTNPQSSIGPLFNQSGDLFGFFKEDNTVIPSWYVSARLNSLLAGDKFEVSFPNLTGRFINNEFSKDVLKSESGFLVREFPNTNKIQKGDVILKVNDFQINSEQAASKILQATPPFQITLQRGKEIKTVKVNN